MTTTVSQCLSLVKTGLDESIGWHERRDETDLFVFLEMHSRVCSQLLTKGVARGPWRRTTVLPRRS